MQHLGAAVARSLAYHSPVIILQDMTPSRLESTADRAGGDKVKQAQAQSISGKGTDIRTEQTLLRGDL